MLSQRSTVTPREAMAELEEPPDTLARLNYHLWVLGRYELIETTDARMDPGLPYRLTNRGHLALEALRGEEDGA
ncbi:MAG: hypothetical protein ACM3Q9_02010 [Methanosarcina sp.]